MYPKPFCQKSSCATRCTDTRRKKPEEPKQTTVYVTRRDLPVPLLPSIYCKCCWGRLVVSLGLVKTSSSLFPLLPSWSIASQTRPNAVHCRRFSVIISATACPTWKKTLVWCNAHPSLSSFWFVERGRRVRWPKSTMYLVRRLRSHFRLGPGP